MFLKLIKEKTIENKLLFQSGMFLLIIKLFLERRLYYGEFNEKDNK